MLLSCCSQSIFLAYIQEHFVYFDLRWSGHLCIICNVWRTTFNYSWILTKDGGIVYFPQCGFGLCRQTLI